MTTAQSPQVIRYRNISNFVWANVFAVGLLASAFLAWGHDALWGPDADSPTIFWSSIGSLFLASVFAHIVLARPYIEVHSDMVVVHNPLHRYVIPRHLITNIQSSSSGFPGLVVGSRRVRLYGAEQTLLQDLNGSGIQIVLAENLAKPSTGNELVEMTKTLALPTPPLLALLAGWTVWLFVLFRG